MTTTLCCFKHTWTGISIVIPINPELPIIQLRNKINEQIVSALRTEHYEIIEAGQPAAELANSIIYSPVLKVKNFETFFYIRPKNQPIPNNFIRQREINHANLDTESESESELNCSICYQNNSINNRLHWECNHHLNCCSECINSWRHQCISNRRTFTCPLCRASI